MKTRIQSSNNKIINTTGITIIVFAILLKGVGYFLSKGFLAELVNGIYIFLYPALFILWGIALKQRVIQKYTRFCLMAIMSLELLWVLIRTVKYKLFTDNITAARYAWYLYYLPMLLMPALCLLLAVMMGKTEEYRPRRFLWLFPTASVLLFLVVLTNDIHQTVFIIPPGRDGLEVGNYSYGFCYTVIAIYIFLCALASYGIIFVKCRVKNKKYIHFLPLVPLTIGTVLCGLNIAGIVVLFGFYHLDITIIFCLSMSGTLEACIQSGLILTNNGYDRLFVLSGIRAVITDKEYQPIISSENYEEISQQEMKRAVNEPVMLDDGIRLSSSPIEKGYVFWQDDVSELDRVLQELSEVNDYLQGENAALQQALEFQKKERRLIEKNRLYNTMLTQTRPEIELYARLIDQLEAETDRERKKETAVKIAFVSAFLKRRDNLIFLNEAENQIAPSELYYCVDESLSVLRLREIECYCSYELTQPIDFDTVIRIYEAFYKVLYDMIDLLSSVCVYLIESDNGAKFLMRICCKKDEDLTRFCTKDILAEKEENEWVLTFQ